MTAPDPEPIALTEEQLLEVYAMGLVDGITSGAVEYAGRCPKRTAEQSIADVNRALSDPAARYEVLDALHRHIIQHQES